MNTVTKEMRFEAAHLLEGHPGRCASLHGHSYRVQVTVSNRIVDKDMVIDFSDLKKLMMDVIDPFDHAFIYEDKHSTVGATGRFLDTCMACRMRFVGIVGRPTAENMVENIVLKLNHQIEREYENLQLEVVRLWETETSFAEWRRGR